MRKNNNNTWLIVAAAIIIVIAGVYFWRKGNGARCQEICFSTTGEQDCSVVCTDASKPATETTEQPAA